MKGIYFLCSISLLLIVQLSRAQESTFLQEEAIDDVLCYNEEELMYFLSDRSISLDTCISVINAPYCYTNQTVIDQCMESLDLKATDLLLDPLFTTLSEPSLSSLLQRDSFYAPEIAIFLSVKKWIENNPNANKEEVVSFIRFPLMSVDEIINVVRPSKLLNLTQLLDAIAQSVKSDNLPYRVGKWPDENIATAEFDAKTIRGENSEMLLKSDVDADNGFTSHAIFEQTPGIIVELGKISSINHIKMRLYDLEDDSYSYYVEVSINQKKWEKVIDYSKYDCRSWQKLYFEPRAVRYIRVVGTRNTKSYMFRLMKLEAMLTTSETEIICGVINPTYTYNLANNIDAKVIEGKHRENLLNDDNDDYTFNSIGSDAGIVLQLNQPYIIDTVRIRLWDGDSRTYSFYILTSYDGRQWQMVADKRKDKLSSWQTLTFSARPVVYIKYIGTHNSIDSGFHVKETEILSQSLGPILQTNTTCACNFQLYP